MVKNINSIKWLSSLAKVMPGVNPMEEVLQGKPSFFTNEVYSFQCAYYVDGRENDMVKVKAGGSLKNFTKIRQVCLMPARFAGRKGCDENYISFEPGLYPDLLRDLEEGQVRLYSGQWQALYITIDLRNIEEDKLPLGEQDFHLTFYDKEQVEEIDRGVVSDKLSLLVRSQKLPEQKLYHTEWFHVDCLADYYKVEPWSEEHWEVLEHYISHYAEMGMNTILVPTFTPALDTAVNHERTTVQLMEVTYENGSYTFGFDRLYRFIHLCRQHRILNFEIAHLFTQWGAKAAPKVMGVKDGTLQKLFGWETDSKSLGYLTFLEQYLTALTRKLDDWDLRRKVFFHLSDEPEEKDRENYSYLKEKISPFLSGYPILDAVSLYSFYEQGMVEKPVPGINHLDLFLENKVPHLWTYYCSAQEKNVTNRFFSMPSARNRVLGILLYYHGIEGFLHWGYNFYNTQYSLQQINPYEVTDAGGAFPSGDSFLVYPGANRYPEDSLRMMALMEAMQDIRALELLESLSSREEVLEILREWAGGKLTMVEYPHSSTLLLELREKINERIIRRIDRF